MMALHNTTKLAELPNQQVLVCETLVSAEAAQRRLGSGLIATTWAGDLVHADWSQLRDRRVGLLVEPGLEEALVAAINPFALIIKAIDRPADAGPRWTLADAPQDWSLKANARVVFERPEPVAYVVAGADASHAPAEGIEGAVGPRDAAADPPTPARLIREPDIDFAGLIEPVARYLLGEPNAKLSSPTKLFYGTNGSLSINLEKGVWIDRESVDGGGGVLDLIIRQGVVSDPEKAKARAKAREWLKRQGFVAQPAAQVPARKLDDEAKKLRRVRETFANCDAAELEQDYIVRKQGKPDGLRTVSWQMDAWGPLKGRSMLGWLAVPAYAEVGNAGDLMAVQYIGPGKGEKLNSAAPIGGCTFTVGDFAPGEIVYIVEGIGHAWSLNAVTGRAAVVSFSAGNIKVVAAKVKAAGGIPVIVPDRGQEAAAASTAASLGCWHAPLPDDLADGSDVNDLHLERGAAAVRAVLNAAIAPRGADLNHLRIEHCEPAVQGAIDAAMVPTDPNGAAVPAGASGAVGKPPTAAQVRATVSDGMRDDDEALEPAVVREADRPVIVIERNNVKAINDQAEKALVTACPFLYSRGGEIVRPMVAMAPDGRGGAVRTIKIRSLKRAVLAEHLDAAACWMKYDGRSKSDVPVDAPITVADALLGRGASSLRPLTGVIEAPTLRADGSILDVPGYDVATGLLYIPNCDYPPVPQAPGRAEALAAMQRIKALIGEYPFVAPVDRSVALAAILTCSVRRALNKAPMFAMNAPAPGSGKSALVDVAAIIVTGSTVPVFAQGENEAEFEKRLHGALLAGHSVVSFDNVTRPIEGNALCQAMTQQTMEVRPLGTSDTRTVPTSTTFFATGNGLVVRDDMTRRVLECQLDPGVERPELRVFDFNPLEVAKAQRATLLVDALTVLRAHHLAQHEVRSRRFDFNEWSAMVADALVWLGYADPAASMDRTRASDPAKDEFRAVAREWTKHFGSKLASVREAIEAATEQSGGSFGTRAEFTRPDFREALLQIAGAGGAINSRSLGKWLARHVKFLVDGLTVHKAEGAQGVQRWGFGQAVLANDVSPPL